MGLIVKHRRSSRWVPPDAASCRIRVSVRPDHGERFLPTGRRRNTCCLQLAAMRIHGCFLRGRAASNAFQPFNKSRTIKSLMAPNLSWMPTIRASTRARPGNPVRPCHVSTSASSAGRYSADASCASGPARPVDAVALFSDASHGARHFLCWCAGTVLAPQAFALFLWAMRAVFCALAICTTSEGKGLPAW